MSHLTQEYYKPHKYNYILPQNACSVPDKLLAPLVTWNRSFHLNDYSGAQLALMESKVWSSMLILANMWSKYKSNHYAGGSKASSGENIMLVAGVRSLNRAYQSTMLLSGMLVNCRCAQVGTSSDFPMDNSELHAQRQMSRLRC